MNSYLERNYGNGLDKELSILKNVDGKILDTKQKEDILVQLGNLSRKPGSILKAIHDDIIKQQLGTSRVQEEKKKAKKAPLSIEKEDDTNATIIIGKERDIPYRLAQCCHPTPQDERIVGVIGQGIITIHTISCPNVTKVELERRIPAYWSNHESKTGVSFEMECIVKDRRGILMELSEIFYHMGLDVHNISADSMENGTTKIVTNLRTDEDDYYIYDRLESRLRFEIPELQSIKLVSMH